MKRVSIVFNLHYHGQQEQHLCLNHQMMTRLAPASRQLWQAQLSLPPMIL